MDYSFSRTRAWFWDVPELRAAAYYFKAQFAAFLLLALLLLFATGKIPGEAECAEIGRAKELTDFLLNKTTKEECIKHPKQLDTIL